MAPGVGLLLPPCSRTPAGSLGRSVASTPVGRSFIVFGRAASENSVIGAAIGPRVLAGGGASAGHVSAACRERGIGSMSGGEGGARRSRRSRAARRRRALNRASMGKGSLPSRGGGVGGGDRRGGGVWERGRGR